MSKRKHKTDWVRRTIAGPVKITHADGTTEVKRAYRRTDELRAILNGYPIPERGDENESNRPDRQPG
jgi:hypothetical protein